MRNQHFSRGGLFLEHSSCFLRENILHENILHENNCVIISNYENPIFKLD